jgi:hypothetical protein
MRLLQVARWAEWYFALVTAYLALQVPLGYTPQDTNRALLLYTLAALAVVIGWQLPKRIRFALAAAPTIAALVIIPGLAGLSNISALAVTTAHNGAPGEGPARVIALLMLSGYLGAQVIVLGCVLASSAWRRTVREAAPPFA